MAGVLVGPQPALRTLLERQGAHACSMSGLTSRSLGVQCQRPPASRLPARSLSVRAAQQGAANDEPTTSALSLEALQRQEQQATTEQQQQEQQHQLEQQRLMRAERRRKEQAVYQFAACAATVGIVSLATFATYYRIIWHMGNDNGAFPVLDLACTLLLAAGGAAFMEMYARWIHRTAWHEQPAGWALHKSHHEPRTGPFELNDIYALVNALPAMGLCLYGFLRPDVIGGLCFGAGLGITLFGISYMFVHDGLVHRRFPVGPIADLPALKRVALAHQLHHSEKYGGVPFGMFLGPQELEAIGAGPELDRMMAEAEAKRAEKKAAAAAASSGKQ